jgi:glutaminyl-tRNA synthetase
VRLRRAYYITCTEVIKNEHGEIVELRATYDPQSKGGCTPDNRRVKGTIHWVSARHSVDAEVRLYDRLFTVERPDAVKDRDWLELINPEALVVKQARLEPALANAEVLDRFQFERVGYFAVDKESRPGALVFNRIAPLKDGWSKMMARSGGQ